MTVANAEVTIIKPNVTNVKIDLTIVVQDDDSLAPYALLGTMGVPANFSWRFCPSLRSKLSFQASGMTS